MFSNNTKRYSRFNNIDIQAGEFILTPRFCSPVYIVGSFFYNADNTNGFRTIKVELSKDYELKAQALVFKESICFCGLCM